MESPPPSNFPIPLPFFLLRPRKRAKKKGACLPSTSRRRQAAQTPRGCFSENRLSVKATSGGLRGSQVSPTRNAKRISAEKPLYPDRTHSRRGALQGVEKPHVPCRGPGPEIYRLDRTLYDSISPAVRLPPRANRGHPHDVFRIVIQQLQPVFRVIRGRENLVLRILGLDCL